MFLHTKCTVMSTDWLSLCSWSSWRWKSTGRTGSRSQVFFPCKITGWLRLFCFLWLGINNRSKIHIRAEGKQAVKEWGEGFKPAPKGSGDAACSAWMLKVRALSVKQVKHCHWAVLCACHSANTETSECVLGIWISISSVCTVRTATCH